MEVVHSTWIWSEKQGFASIAWPEESLRHQILAEWLSVTVLLYHFPDIISGSIVLCAVIFCLWIVRTKTFVPHLYAQPQTNKSFAVHNISHKHCMPLLKGLRIIARSRKQNKTKQKPGPWDVTVYIPKCLMLWTLPRTYINTGPVFCCNYPWSVGRFRIRLV